MTMVVAYTGLEEGRYDFSHQSPQYPGANYQDYQETKLRYVDRAHGCSDSGWLIV